MNHLTYPLQPLGAVNRWLELGIAEQEVSFEVVTMNGEIDNQWLIKGFAVHENPARYKFVAQRRNEEAKLPDWGKVAPGEAPENVPENVPEFVHKQWSVYFPWQNPYVEHPGFWFVPTYLQSWAVTQVRSPDSLQADFRLSTCGGATLWVNGSLIVDFAPFTRNQLQTTPVLVDLQRGWNTFVVRYDDLAERDTLYKFRLDYDGGTPLEMGIPLGDTDPKPILQIEKSLEEAYFPTDTFHRGPVILRAKNPLGQDLLLDVKHRVERRDLQSLPAVWKCDSDFVDLGDAGRYPMGYTFVECSVRLGPISIPRYFGVQIVRRGVSETPERLEERKRTALFFLAKEGEPTLHKALAILAADGDAEEAENLVFRAIEKIERRYDCSDFELIMAFRLWRDYRDKGKLSERCWQALAKSILGYRYWFDEPGNDVMWFFSENHALLFNACELLAGELFPDREFSNAGISGAMHEIRAERHLEGWFERFFREGYAEWNSSAYFPIDVMGLLQVHDLAGSADLREKARQALDMTFRYLAINSYRGHLACSHGRSYENELKGQYCNATAGLAWTAWGTGNLNGATYASVAFALSDYAPPLDLIRLAELRDGEALEFANHQGPASYADLYAYKTPHSLLTSAIEFHPGKKGYQEHVLHATFGPEANLWINHPGESALLGGGRPSYWAGNGCLPSVNQFRNLAVLFFSIDKDHDVDFTHAYVPLFAFDDWRHTGNWLFVQKGDAFAGLFAANGLSIRQAGPTKDREIVSPGRENVWVLRLSDRGEFACFELFCREMEQMAVRPKPGDGEVVLDDPLYGMVSYSRDDTLRIGGAPVENRSASLHGSLRLESLVQDDEK